MVALIYLNVDWVFFSSGEPGHQLLRVHSAGFAYSLSLTLNVNVEEFLVSGRIGFFLYVHHQNESTLSSDMAVAVPPGSATMVGVQKTKVC